LPGALFGGALFEASQKEPQSAGKTSTSSVVKTTSKTPGPPASTKPRSKEAAKKIEEKEAEEEEEEEEGRKIGRGAGEVTQERKGGKRESPGEQRARGRKVEEGAGGGGVKLGGEGEQRMIQQLPMLCKSKKRKEMPKSPSGRSQVAGGDAYMAGIRRSRSQ
jgi:hypothetical protein